MLVTVLMLFGLDNFFSKRYIMYKCQFCENLTYDWDNDWDTEKKKEVMKIVSEHVIEHPESRPVFIGEPVFVEQPVSEIPVTPEEN